MYQISYGVMAVFLIIGTRIDIRCQKIPRWYLMIGTIVVVMLRVCIREYTGIEYIIGGCVGMLFGIISFLTREQFGYGDSWMIGILGICFGIRKLIAVLFLAFLASSLVAGYWMLRKKCDKHNTIPFYPFLCVGCLGGMLL